MWIAFNAAYATEISDLRRTPEQSAFGDFLGKLQSLDNRSLLEGLVWTEFPKSIRVLLGNQFVFQGFWDYHSGRQTDPHWEVLFTRAKSAAHDALGKRDTPKVLSIALSRIYTLRNQLIHGGATWSSQVNRDQLRDAVALMTQLVPTVLTIMMDNPDTLWGDACYPVVS